MLTGRTSHAPRFEEPAESAAAPEAQISDRPAGKREDAQSCAALGFGETILVVEDNANVRQLMLQHLNDLGYRVFEAPGPKEALEFLRRWGPIDLLLTDVVMPGGMNGWQLAQEAARMLPGLKVLFTSGARDAVFRSTALSHNKLLLNKPFRKQELAFKVRRALAGS